MSNWKHGFYSRAAIAERRERRATLARAREGLPPARTPAEALEAWQERKRKLAESDPLYAEALRLEEEYKRSQVPLAD